VYNYYLQKRFGFSSLLVLKPRHVPNPRQRNIRFSEELRVFFVAEKPTWAGEKGIMRIYEARKFSNESERKISIEVFPLSPLPDTFHTLLHSIHSFSFTNIEVVGEGDPRCELKVRLIVNKKPQKHDKNVTQMSLRCVGGETREDLKRQRNFSIEFNQFVSQLGSRSSLVLHSLADMCRSHDKTPSVDSTGESSKTVQNFVVPYQND
jgi:hypothetical protein